MKIQSIFILFNAILVIFIVLIGFFPTLILGADMASFFWRNNWFLLLVFVFILAAFDVFYFSHRRLYSLLEKEDWPALAHYLEDKIFRQGKYSKRLVRLLANSYIILSDSSAVINLESKASIVKASLVDDNVLVFGTAMILGKDFPGAVRFFEARLGTVKPALRIWVAWYFAFSLLLNRQYEKARVEFSRLVLASDDEVITGLSAFILANTIMKALPEYKLVLESITIDGRNKALKALPQEKDWEREIGRIKTEVHALVLSKILLETGQWLYEGLTGASSEASDEPKKKTMRLDV